MAGTAPLSDMVTPIATLDQLLAAYVTGGLPRPVHVLVAAHLEMRPDNRGFVRDMEVLAAGAMAEAEPAPLADRAGMLDRIFAEDGPVRGRPEPALPAAVAHRDGLPPSLAAYVRAEMDDIPWRPVLPGIREWKAKADDEGCEAGFIRVRPGVQVPSHTHGGTEITLVVEGAFRDRTGHYRAGDIAFADDSVDHRPVADRGRDCVCFIVTDAPLRLTGLIGRLISPFAH